RTVQRPCRSRSASSCTGWVVRWRGQGYRPLARLDQASTWARYPSAATSTRCSRTGTEPLTRAATHANGSTTAAPAAPSNAARPLGTPQSMPALAKVADRSLPLLDRAIRDLRALRPPKDEEATVRSWLRQLSLLRGDVVRIRDRARANDARGVRAVVPAATQR